MKKATVADELFVACLKSKDITTLMKVKKDWLDKDEFQKYREITKYLRLNGELIGVKTFCKVYSLDDSLGDSKSNYYFTKLRERHVKFSLLEKLPDILKAIDKNPMMSLDELKILANAFDMEAEGSKDAHYGENPLKRLVSYKEKILTHGISYLGWGHHILDSVFVGVRQNDLVTIGGRAGAKKTFLLCYLAILIEDYMFANGIDGDILFITNEISDEEIIERQDCIRFKLPYDDFIKGQLSKRYIKTYQRGLEEIEERGSKMIVAYNSSSMTDITTKIDLYKPKIVMIDGSYLINPAEKEGWEKITRITRELKQINKLKNIPVINTTQLTRSGGKNGKATHYDAQEEFAYANSYVQDSDLAIRSYQSPDMIYHMIHGLQVAKGRRVNPLDELMFHANLGTMNFNFSLNDYDSTPAELTEF